MVVKNLDKDLNKDNYGLRSKAYLGFLVGHFDLVCVGLVKLLLAVKLCSEN